MTSASPSLSSRSSHPPDAYAGHPHVVALGEAVGVAEDRVVLLRVGAGALHQRAGHEQRHQHGDDGERGHPDRRTGCVAEDVGGASHRCPRVGGVVAAAAAAVVGAGADVADAVARSCRACRTRRGTASAPPSRSCRPRRRWRRWRAPSAPPGGAGRACPGGRCRRARSARRRTPCRRGCRSLARRGSWSSRVLRPVVPVISRSTVRRWSTTRRRVLWLLRSAATRCGSASAAPWRTLPSSRRSL